ncbi:MAG: hypothetical protein AMJ89_02340 [candidate division Zixibacteria bacterium SM23_73]|nr:MAG: hypothetical protein AMJ89_02340 [candidate division Zixibacteria bacterium SM23_73]
MGFIRLGFIFCHTDDCRIGHLSESLFIKANLMSKEILQSGTRDKTRDDQIENKFLRYICR